MNQSRGDEICLSRVHLNVFKRSLCPSLAHRAGKIPDGHPVRKAVDELCSGLRLHDVPHFRFTNVVFHHGSVFIVRVHLNGQIVGGINELYEKRKIAARKTLAYK